MKDEIIKVSKQLEQGIISENKAKSLLLTLFGINNFPLTVKKVSIMLDECSKETWIAAHGSNEGWKKWYDQRNNLTK